MRQPPPLTHWQHYPVTTAAAVLACAVTFFWWTDRDVSLLFMHFRAFETEPWRLITSVFLHADIVHLLFNLYWLWVFGTLVEEVFGSLRTAGIIALFAVGSSAAEFAVFIGGVGLSGVGYGLFGLLWVLSRKDARFADAVDQPTVLMFLAWFVLCCVLTAMDVWRIGNVAHGAGAVLGALLGFAIVSQGRARIAMAWLFGSMVAICVLVAALWRPYVNFSSEAGQVLAYEAYQAQTAEDNEKAIVLYRRALEFKTQQASWWYNLGLAHRSLEQFDQASESLRRAADLEPDNKQYREVLKSVEAAIERV